MNRPVEYHYVIEALKMLAVHQDMSIKIAADGALEALRDGNVALFKHLHWCGDTFNPYKGKGYRQKCLDAADTKCRNSHRCAVAQLFYELSEGLYRPTTYLRRVLSAKYPLDLTQAAA